MKKILFYAIFLPMALQAQVGINTNTPRATLEVKRNIQVPNTQPQGVLFPKFTTDERTKFSDTAEEGTVIYNTERKCLEIYLGLYSGIHKWSCLLNKGVQNTNLIVAPEGFERSYMNGIAFNNSQKVKFKLENNSFSDISSSFADVVTIQNGMATITTSVCQWQKLNGNELVGSMESCSSGNLINLNSGESAMLWYTMDGIPEAGTLQANFSKFGVEANQEIQVNLGSASISSSRTEYIPSLQYTGSDYQGKINNTTRKLVVRIPYTDGNGSYNTVTSQAVTTAEGQNGDINTLTLNIPGGNFSTAGVLEATINVDGDGEYLVKMLEPGKEYDITTIPFILNGQQYNVVLKGIGGIPDRCFGKTTFDCVGYGAKEREHEFIYTPITGPDGKIWLSNNLGAEYTKVGSQWFNPTRQAGSFDDIGAPLTDPTANQIKKDWRAYGSLFQWQRNPDGHELINRISSVSGTPKYDSPTASLSSSWTNPGHSNFITNYTSNNASWVNDSLNNATTEKNLWQINGSNNPCPEGYHVPTNVEQEALHNSILGYTAGTNSFTRSTKMWNEINLRLPASGYRGILNGNVYIQSVGNLWSSNQNSNMYSWNLFFNSNNSNVGGNFYRANGYGIRCLHD
ncbi:FISUMP domain-containing protein [Riemerella anatipestifer]|uniref:FISUMP domain-containing protein n=2 Tax=Riemerella anatipestifer TaxID=34085 RepID=UPI0007ECED96|nr:FISUMP domain-containing protein [Riemerella anatipestifer]AZZ58017.1 hypothetical protein AWB57_02600 [Riemerella anatipestifer]MCW0510095.1 fibrobacter succinogenes major paralogous domain-containing protein [Riemerella anatipestifer]MDY3389789.1 FISUMP domain-containing protein [Riemerella anatipestifer]MDY3517732.1 FISUMP domain-containing protein [Riemerella anatipestifer]MDY3542704.1 FISUMP domain-containing protein [Riemerella anatipestifer]